MKRFRLMTVIAALGILAGCATAAQRRQGYVDGHPGLPPELAAAIIEGRILEGMTAEDVRAAWGDPERETMTVTEAGDQETWSYPTPIGRFDEGTVILIFTNRKLIKLIN